MILERDLHSLGYSYLGYNSLYNLTWWEIADLQTAGEITSEITELEKKDVPPEKKKKFEQYDFQLNQRFN